jgi:hypothetical protein
MKWHCQVVGENIVPREQQVLAGRDGHRPAREAARCVPVIAAHLSQRCRLAGRDSGADRRCRLGRKCWAMGPYAAKPRWACPADGPPGRRPSRWRVGRCACAQRVWS